MDRRDAVKYISVLMGSALVGGDAFLLGCKSNSGKTDWLSAESVAYLDEIGETILPRTKTPGAKDAQVGKFMQVMVNDCYEEGDQRAFKEGMDKLNDASKKKFDKTFMEASPEQRKELLIAVDKEAKDYQKSIADYNRVEDDKYNKNLSYVRQKKSPHYFTMMKQLTLLGFFTSKPGLTQALRYNAVPGKFEGCIPYKKGDPAFA
ncbi:gluconate 2-dehydrogenase subunit 3 family protein [Flavisolibacter ginsenosidimutans]|uniref:Gluconate 2-dehydrogenase subunit 3 family protein n=1 Tax=Flavisolibacter ginsenosidimutans TaxID=661481 RepID=A0A5B8UFM1_9BACT|nr:gluconate 2-dehydrogenase subunit 3 family protein [Flavisolibacter ginsenosidimutans]QEC55481.1 gluconate 2-dehydrogenase subunit 3 family protein [Flavisolibacter ginsenosidimutans]